MNRMGQARELVARAVMNVPIGAQLPPTAVLARLAGTGNGTVQLALKSLEDEGSVGFTAHGGHGRVLRDRNLRSLWVASGRGPIRGILPLPQSREFAGLATAFSMLAEKTGISLQLLFRQGSKVRFDHLDSGGADFVVASAYAAQAAGKAASSWTLGVNTYYGPDAVVVITRFDASAKEGGRVPIDRTSADHVALTEREFPDAELVDTPYLFIPEMIATGKFDAAVWHLSASSPLLTAIGLAVHPLSKPLNRDRDSDEDRAAISWRADEPGLGELLREVFEVPELERLQRSVIGGEQIPQF